MVGAGTVHVELGRVCGIDALQYNFVVVLLVGTSYVESFLEIEFIVFAVDGNDTLATDIDYAKFTVVEKSLLVMWLVCVESGERCQLYGCCCRHGTTYEETVEESVCPVYFAWCKYLFNEKLLTQA